MGIIGTGVKLAAKAIGKLANHPLAGIAANIGGTAIANKQSNKLNNEQFQRSMDFARENHEMERKEALADRAHEEKYNTPLAQMQRLRDAGLNPVDFMSAPVETSTAAPGAIDNPSAPEMAAPLAGLGGIGSSLFDMSQNAKLNEAKIENLEAETAEKKRQTREGNDTFEVRQEALKAELDNERKQLEKTQQDINESASRSNLNESQKRSIDLANDLNGYALANNKALSDMSVVAAKLSNDKLSTEIDKLTKEIDIAISRLNLDSWLTSERVKEIQSGVRATDLRTALDSFDLGIKEQTRNEMINTIEYEAQSAADKASIQHQEANAWLTQTVLGHLEKVLGVGLVTSAFKK